MVRWRESKQRRIALNRAADEQEVAAIAVVAIGLNAVVVVSHWSDVPGTEAMRCSKGTPSCVFSACDSSDVSIGEGEGVGVKESADEGRISTPGIRR